MSVCRLFTNTSGFPGLRVPRPSGPVFFFFPRKWKVREKTRFSHFFRFFFGQKMLFSPTFPKIFSGILTFFGADFQIDSRVENCIFWDRNFRIWMYFRDYQAVFVYFFLGQGLFFSGWFSCFFSGKNVSSRAVFKIFSREDFKQLGQKIEIFRGRIFFSRGKNTVLVT